MENSPTDSPPIDPSNALTTTTSSTASEKRPESSLESANSSQTLHILPSSSPLVATPTPTAVSPAPIQLVGKSTRKRKAPKQIVKQPKKEEDDKMYIDTQALCKRIAYELKQHAIPQGLFAERVLNRSQGTLSDLLRNPKPWNRLHSKGRQTFVHMLDWLKLPLLTRLNILDTNTNTGPDELEKQASSTTSVGAVPDARKSDPANVDQADAVAVARFQRKISSVTGDFLPANRGPRRAFHPIQKRALEEILTHTQRPSREMQVQIAQHLKLDLARVANYFMNARKRLHVSEENAASSTQMKQQLAAVVNDHASYLKPQDAAEVGSND